MEITKAIDKEYPFRIWLPGQGIELLYKTEEESTAAMERLKNNEPGQNLLKRLEQEKLTAKYIVKTNQKE